MFQVGATGIKMDRYILMQLMSSLATDLKAQMSNLFRDSNLFNYGIYIYIYIVLYIRLNASGAV
jgi:hypothetical protein